LHFEDLGKPARRTWEPTKWRCLCGIYDRGSP